MITRVVLESLAAIATVVLGSLFWMDLKRKRATRTILDNRRLLQRIVTLGLLETPPPQIERLVPSLKAGYKATMAVFIMADQRAHRRLRLYIGIAAALVVMASAFLNPWFVLLNAALFYAFSFGRPGESEREQAMEFVQIAAVILYRWRMANRPECDVFVEHAVGLQNLYAHVIEEGDASSGQRGARPPASGGRRKRRRTMR